MDGDKNRGTLVLTGATGGIGSAFAHEASKCADLILVDQNQKKLVELQKSLFSRDNSNHKAVVCDLSVEKDRDRLISEISSEYDMIDGLINNAAYTGDTLLSGWIEDFENQTTEAWRAALEVNLTAAFDLSRGFYRLLKHSSNGNILNVGSIYGLIGPDLRIYDGTTMGNPAAYAASKGGLIQLTKWLATTLAPEVRVNCVSPGGVFRNQDEKFVSAYVSRTPLGRMADESDIVGAMMFLSVGKSQYITGENITVDGGYSVW